jgi:hypothetical protein
VDIKKCKVQKNCEWSVAVVKGLAVTLGMSALVSLEGCASNAAKTGDDLAKSISPSPSLSELSSSSISDSISSSSSNDSDNETQMIEKILKKLDSDPFSELSEEEMEELKKYIESHREEPSGGVMELD